MPSRVTRGETVAICLGPILSTRVHTGEIVTVDMAPCPRAPRGRELPSSARRVDPIGLCPPCVDRTRTELTSLPHLYMECEQALLTLHGGSVVPRARRTSVIDLPISEAAAHARSLISGVLASW